MEVGLIKQNLEVKIFPYNRIHMKFYGNKNRGEVKGRSLFSSYSI